MIDDRAEQVAALSKHLAKNGRLIEAGWVTLRFLSFPEATGEQVDQLRDVFFAGAQHLFGSIINILGQGGDEPSANELVCMDQINEELRVFLEQFMKRHNIKEQ